MEGAPNYWEYLKLDRLLSLQGGLEDDESSVSADELHFIVVHQTYELWFKVILREIRLARDRLGREVVPEDDIPGVVRHLDRVIEILNLAVAQWRVMETLSPHGFLEFRDRLVPASGFQSFQMRELEILLGLEESERVACGETEALTHIRRQAESSPGGELALRRVRRAEEEPTLKEALRVWLRRTPIMGSGPDDAGDEETVRGFVASYLQAVEKHHLSQARLMAGTGEELEERFARLTQAASSFLLAEEVEEEERPSTRRIRAGILFIESYRDLPLLAWPRTLLDRIVALEQQLVVWRTRHARMVERMIGRRVGTGGSSGVEYLDKTAGYRIFTELWSVRTMLLPREELPPLANEAAYGFK